MPPHLPPHLSPLEGRARPHLHTWARRGALAAAIGSAGWLAGCTAWKIPEARRIAAQAVPYQQQPATPSRHLLVLGDSTGVGTGAQHPRDSVAGRIGQLHPDWRIENRAVNGARLKDVAAQLAASSARPDLVLLMVGGNDVLRLSNAEDTRRLLDQSVQDAQARGARVLLFPPGDVGHAPLLMPPVSWWMSERSKSLHEAVASVAQQRVAAYIDIRRPAGDDPFVQEPRRFHAADGLHPSSEGYRLWFEALQASGALR